MAAARHSRSEAEMAAALARLDPKSERFRVLAAARRFKASWVELGEVLTEVRESAGYRQWGYPTFEAYCRRELHVRQDTANKLTRSFAFLRDHRPEALGDAGDRALPALDMVDLLCRAQGQASLAGGALATICDQALNGDIPMSRQQVMKELRAVDPEVFKPAAKPPVAPGENDLRKALLLAERLQSLLEAQGEAISRDAVAHARHVVRELRERFQHSRRQGAA